VPLELLELIGSADVPSTSSTISFDTQNKIVTCISVIDESGGQNNNFDTKWADLRATYPDRPFCLLQPQETDGIPFSKTSLDIPDAFDLDTGAKYENVSCGTADITNPSDRYELCGLE
jgi:hypothetical protein